MKFPHAGIVQTDKNNNKVYKTFPEILKEKREKAEKEEKAQEKESKSELGNESTAPRPSPMGSAGGSA